MDNTLELYQSSTSDEIRRLGKLVNDLEGKFREQRLQLQKQAMSLPPGTLGGLQQIRTDLEVLAFSFSESQTELQQLRALSHTAEIINSTLDPDDVLNRIMDTVISLTKAERGYLMLTNPDTGQMEFRVARNIEQRNLESDEAFFSTTVVQQVAISGEPLLTVDAGSDPLLNLKISIISGGLRSILCVPLLLKGNVTGVIYTDNRVKLGLFGEKEQQLLQAFANQAAIAIENARLFDRLRASLAEITTLRDLLDNVFASIASGVITADPTDRITRVNDAACRILNLNLQTALGQIMWEILPPLHDNLAVLVEMVRQRDLETTLEVEKIFEPHGKMNLNLKLSPLRNAERQTEGVAIVVDDLTELKQREEQLRVVRRYLTPAMVDNIDTIDKLGLGGERRTVTIMYVDVRPFHSFPALHPQAFMSVLNSYLTIASDAISLQNGIIDKYMANEIMGLFNTQLNPTEDHAYHAIEAALKMAEAYTDFYKKTHEPDGACYFRIGIHTGVATLGNVGSENRREFTAIGDSVNLAHRLLENAEVGQIVISEETARSCGPKLAQILPDVRVDIREDLRVKGRDETTGIYRVNRKQ